MKKLLIVSALLTQVGFAQSPKNALVSSAPSMAVVQPVAESSSAAVLLAEVLLNESDVLINLLNRYSKNPSESTTIVPGTIKFQSYRTAPNSELVESVRLQISAFPNHTVVIEKVTVDNSADRPSYRSYLIAR